MGRRNNAAGWEARQRALQSRRRQQRPCTRTLITNLNMDDEWEWDQYEVTGRG